MFKYSKDNKHYHTLNYHLKTLFKDRVFKASLDAGFSCPNKKAVGVHTANKAAESLPHAAV